jgi:cytochrome c553
MKFSRILGVVAAVLVTTAVAQQAKPAKPAAPAPAAAAPADAKTSAPVTQPSAPTQTANTPSTATITTTPSAQPAPTGPEADPAAPVVAAADTRPATWGDAKAGATKAGACAACHGIDGNSGDPQYPKLAGQHEAYIWRQLKLFKSGERANPIMQGMAAPLSEQDMRDIGAFFATQKGSAGVADDTPVATGPNAGKAYFQIGERVFRGGKKGVPACQACHGPVGRGIPGPTYPSIGGQHSGYTVAQLKFFRDGGVHGTEANANKIMATVAKDLTDEEIQGLATYIEGLHPAAAPTAQAAK